jgi:hypothetical protein
MTKKQNLLLVIVVAWLLAISACTVVSVGFTVKTQDRVNTPSGRINVDASLREVGGRFLSDIGRASFGSRTGFFGTTGFDARFHVDDGRVPANWSLSQNSGPCSGFINEFSVAPSETTPLICDQTRSFVIFSFSPEIILISTPPASFVIGGEAMDTTYGMPLIQLYDESGSLVAYTYATAVNAGGTEQQASTPDLSQCYNGLVAVLISNATPDGYFEPIGTALVEITGGVDPPDPCILYPELCAPLPEPDPAPCYPEMICTIQ